MRGIHADARTRPIWINAVLSSVPLTGVDCEEIVAGKSAGNPAGDASSCVGEEGGDAGFFREGLARTRGESEFAAAAGDDAADESVSGSLVAAWASSGGFVEAGDFPGAVADCFTGSLAAAEVAGAADSARLSGGG